MNKQKILDMLSVKEYWLNREEQELIDRFRESKSTQYDNKTNKGADNSESKGNIKTSMPG